MVRGSVWQRADESAAGRPERASGAKANGVAAGFGLVALGVFAALYIWHRDLYFSVIDWWSFGEWDYPFLDLIYVPSQIDCWNAGIDVYVRNPCDPLGRVHDYSPLWLRLWFLGGTKPFINVLGLGLDGLFMLSLAALPRPGRKIDYLPLLLGVISPVSVFALERGNVDLLMFILVMAAVVCMDRMLALRLVGYGAVMAAGCLKFYPFVVFVLLARERLRTSLIGAVMIACGVAGFGWYYLDELPRMAVNIPRPFPFGDGFGSYQLPVGIHFLLRYWVERRGLGGIALPLSQTSVPFLVIYVLLTLAAYMTARNLSQRDELRLALRELTQRESVCLMAGAALVCGCFLSFGSIGYREIVILLVLPGLTAMARSLAGTALSKTFHGAVWVAVFLMMVQVPRRFVDAGLDKFWTNGMSLPAFALWLLRELCWWWLVAVLAAVLVRLVLDSTMWQEAADLLRRRARSGATGLVEEPLEPR